MNLLCATKKSYPDVIRSRVIAGRNCRSAAVVQASREALLLAAGPSLSRAHGLRLDNYGTDREIRAVPRSYADGSDRPTVTARDHAARIASSLAGRYSIEQELGRGGMATVYLAEDLKHRRKVAIKVLEPELAGAIGPDRFLREIEIVARLTHPHILPMHDSGEATGLLYYVMPYVEGETLRQRLRREKQFPVGEALTITRQIAAALDYAHRQGLVHRDVKPENILLHHGEAMLADFGIALAVRTAGGDRLTEAGLSLGTPEYMSPEQVTGEQNLDARCDIYALGCVLYEMLAGEPPYTGPTPAAIFAKRFTDPVPSVSRLRASIPEPVDVALQIALAKVATDRFSTAADFAAALTEPWPATPEQAKTIAILPFANLSADPHTEYFTDGMTEDVTAQLSKIASLRVTSRTSVLRFRDRRDKSVREIGQELGVGAILEGSVRQAGNRVRIVAQLIDVRTDAHLWSETYDRELTDVFAIQSDVALQVANALKAALSSGEQARVVRKPTENLEAYKALLLGRHHWNKWTEDGFTKSQAYFEKAIELDPKYALAYSWLADSYGPRANYGFLSPREAWPKARAAALKARQLDDTLGGGYPTLGIINLFYDWDWPAAEQEFQRAMRLHPNAAEPHHTYGYYLVTMRRFDEAVAEITRALALDPLSLIANANLATFHYLARRYDDAVEQARRTVEMEPYFAQGHYELGNALGAMGHLTESMRTLEQAVALSGGSHAFKASLGYTYAVAGRTVDAQRIVDELDADSKQRYVSSYFLAEVFAGLGERNRALHFLDQAYEERAGYMAWLHLWPRLDPLRGDARFQTLVRRIRLPV